MPGSSLLLLFVVRSFLSAFGPAPTGNCRHAIRDVGSFTRRWHVSCTAGVASRRNDRWEINRRVTITGGRTRNVVKTSFMPETLTSGTPHFPSVSRCRPRLYWAHFDKRQQRVTSLMKNWKIGDGEFSDAENAGSGVARNYHLGSYSLGSLGERSP